MQLVKHSPFTLQNFSRATSNLRTFNLYLRKKLELILMALMLQANKLQAVLKQKIFTGSVRLLIC